MIDVEVVYATRTQQYLLKATVLPNSTIEDVIIASGILEKCPEIDLTKNKVGIFSRLATLQDRVRPWDRVEIYRPLLVDPKQSRTLRAKTNPLRKSRKDRVVLKTVVLNAICKAYDLGERISLPIVCHGGLLHAVWKFETKLGWYVVKKLNAQVAKQNETPARYRLTERLVRKIGKVVPAISACTHDEDVLFIFNDDIYLVYPYVDAKVIQQNEITAKNIIAISNALSSIHALNLHHEAPSAELFLLDEKTLDKAIAEIVSHQPVIAELLEKTKPLIQAITQKCEQYKSVLKSNLIISHRDCDPKNVLWQDDEFFIIDWESVGLINSTKDTVATAIYWSLDEAYQVNLGYLELFIRNYAENSHFNQNEVEAGLYGFLSDWLGWLHFNLTRLNFSKNNVQYLLGALEAKKTLDALHVLWPQLSGIMQVLSS